MSVGDIGLECLRTIGLGGGAGVGVGAGAGAGAQAAVNASTKLAAKNKHITNLKFAVLLLFICFYLPKDILDHTHHCWNQFLTLHRNPLSAFPLPIGASTSLLSINPEVCSLSVRGLHRLPYPVLFVFANRRPRLVGPVLPT